jgi:hypothetical protein
VRHFPLIEKRLVLRGQDVTIREWSGTERKEFFRLRPEDPAGALAFMVATCVVAPKVEVGDVGEFPTAVLDELVGEIVTLNGMDRDDKGGDSAKNA